MEFGTVFGVTLAVIVVVLSAIPNLHLNMIQSNLVNAQNGWNKTNLHGVLKQELDKRSMKGGEKEWIKWLRASLQKQWKQS